jgi:tetratricopeptide (TPR) repeat protein
MAAFDSDQPEERLAQEAEELMRQRRFQDAVTRYQDLRRQSPTDLWTNLGYVSALECAGRVAEAEKILEEATIGHDRSAMLHRFRHLFFVRREDLPSAARSQKALRLEVLEEGPEDQLADLYFNQGRYYEARSELERLLRDKLLDHDDHAELKASVVARIGACLRQSGDYEAARERLAEALALEPGNHWTLSELAETERALGNVVQARRRYREALEANPDDHWTRGHLAQLECEDGNHAVATQLYEEILTAEPKAAWAKVELAQVVAEQDTERSAELLASALEDDPNFPWAHAQFGNLSRRAGRLDEARTHYQRAAAAAPGAIWILHEQADICRQLGRLEEAHSYLEHARGINPYDAVTYGYIADVLRHEGKSQQAMVNLEKAVDIDANYTWAWRELAELRALSNRHDEAEAAYQKACAIEPGEAVNDGLKAFILRCQNRRELATPYLTRAVELQPDYLWAWRERIDYAFSIGRYDQAETISRQALVALPDTPPLMAMLAEALRKQGRREEAKIIINNALKLANEAPQLWAIKAEIAAEDGDLASAEQAARRGVELDRSVEYQALLAQVILANGDDVQADSIVQTLLAAPQPIISAYEIAATIAERRGQREQAIAYCDQALNGAYADEPRLRIRRARLLLIGTTDTAAQREIVSPLIPLFERSSGVPWRELAHVFATTRHAALARRAGHLFQAAAPANEQGRAWLTLAELELALGQIDASQQALDLALRHDPKAVAALILGAVLSEQRGDHTTAIARLEQLDKQLAEADPGAEAGSADAVLHRQLVLLYERTARYDDAEAMWQRILNNHPTHLPHQAEYCCYLLRRDRANEANQRAETLLPDLIAKYAEANETQRFIKDLAIYRAGEQGPRAGMDVLLSADEKLNVPGRLLLAQLSMLIEERVIAHQQIDLILQGNAQSRPARLLRVRLLAQERKYDSALKLAETLAEEQPDDQEAATLMAECLAVRGRAAEALSRLDAVLKRTTPTTDAGLVAALLALDVHGEAACLMRLGRLSIPSTPSPLARVMIAAWPNAWNSVDPTPGATTADLRSLPPFPNIAQRLSFAFGRAGRYDLASDLLQLVAGALRHEDRLTESRALLALAITPLIRCGRRRAAFTVAGESRSLLAMLRCLGW